MVSRPSGRIARIVGRLEAMGVMPAPATERKESHMTTKSEAGAGAAGPMPAALAAVPAGKISDVDVRETLRAGGEPFGAIMAARRALQPGGVLRIRAIFEPVPLYLVFASHGLEHWTERLAEDDWRVWFFAAQGEAAAGPEAVGSAPATDDVVVLDVRELDPPEPMARTLAALESLPAGGTLVQLNTRVPRFLLPMLEEQGYTYEVREQEDTLVRTFIRRPGACAGQVSNGKERNDMAETTAPELDVRPIPPREKHSTIFQTYGALQAGEAFVLVNDHDPVPLRYQFEAQHAGQYGWEYLAQGPEVWRVRISRR